MTNPIGRLSGPGLDPTPLPRAVVQTRPGCPPALAKLWLFLFLVLVLVLALAPPCGNPASATPAAPPQAGLQPLIDRYVAWRGGDAFRRLRSSHVVGAMKATNPDGTTGMAWIERWTTRDGQVREQFSWPGFKMLRVVGAKDHWTSANDPAAATTLDDDAAGTLGHLAQLDLGAPFEGAAGVDLKLMGEARRAGRTWAVVRVRFPGGGASRDIDALFDAQTGALHGYEYMWSGKRYVFTYDDWRMVDGVRMPFSINDQPASGAANLDSLTSVAVNPSLAPALFEHPPAVRLTAIDAGAASTGWIDFEGMNDNRIIFPVTINGHQTLAVLDSDMTASLLNQDYARSIGMVPYGATPFSGQGGIGDAGLVAGVDIRLGALTLNGMAIATSPMRIPEPPSPTLILGAEVFSELVVDIDFEHHRIAFRDPARFQPPGGAVVIPVTRNGLKRLVPIGVADAPEDRFSIDLGDPGSLTLSPDFAARRALLKGRPTAEWITAGIGGDVVNDLAVLPKARFAGLIFKDAPARFPHLWPKTTYADNEQGFVGVDLVKRYHLIFDWPHDRMFAIPNSDATTAPWAKDRLGLGLDVGDGALVVSQVSPHSPAAAAGIKVGDEITTINNQPATPAAIHLGEGPAGTKVVLAWREVSRQVTGATTVTTTRTTQGTVTLADYY